MAGLLKGIDWVNKVLNYVIGIILMIMSVLIAYQVFSRFVLKNSLHWSEELSRYLMIWLIFLGAAVALRHSLLIGVEALSERLKFKAKRALKTVVHIVSISFFIIMIMHGIDMLNHVSTQLSPAMKIPMTIPYAAVPVGGFLMLMNSIAVLIEFYTAKEEK